jgi:hypothetical protein
MTPNRLPLVVTMLALAACARLEKIEAAPRTLSFTSTTQALTITAKGFDQKGREMPKAAFAFKSSDPAVATVDELGVVKPVKSGSASIEVASGEKKDTVEVDVSIPGRLVLEPGAVVLAGVGTKAVVKVKLFDDADRPVPSAQTSLSVADAGVVQVDGTTLTALSIGTTKLVASLQGTSIKAEAEVTVQQPAFETLELTAVSSDLQVGDETTLATVAKNGGGELVENVRPSFTSSDETVVAIVDGRARGLKAGTAILTAVAGDKSSAPLSVTVSDPAAKPVKGPKRR